MPVGYTPPDTLYPVAGVRLGVAEAAIKKPGRHDLLVVALPEGTTCAGVFTRNAFCAAPVWLCRERLSTTGGAIRALVVNSGNANAATGEGGLEDARAVCAAVAAELGCETTAVLPFSTGVIGQRLPVARMTNAVPEAVRTATESGTAWQGAMRAIMTTDTVPKGATRQVATSAGTVTVTGIAKGVGMIQPDMATMLAFIGTDAAIPAPALKALLGTTAEATFNRVTVDGDTSTNDACMLFATGQVGGAAPLLPGSPDFGRVAAAIHEVARELAQALVRDGEGATKFVTVRVRGARTPAEARQVAFSIANSPLVKTAWFASDANWGRLAMAIGKSGVSDLSPTTVDLDLDDVPLLRAGQPHPDYTDAKGTEVVRRQEFTVGVHLGRGEAETTVWTCDFSYDYVKINAEYRT